MRVVERGGDFCGSQKQEISRTYLEDIYPPLGIRETNFKSLFWKRVYGESHVCYASLTFAGLLARIPNVVPGK